MTDQWTELAELAAAAAAWPGVAAGEFQAAITPARVLEFIKIARREAATAELLSRSLRAIRESTEMTLAMIRSAEGRLLDPDFAALIKANAELGMLAVNEIYKRQELEEELRLARATLATAAEMTAEGASDVAIKMAQMEKERDHWREARRNALAAAELLAEQRDAAQSEAAAARQATVKLLAAVQRIAGVR